VIIRRSLRNPYGEERAICVHLEPCATQTHPSRRRKCASQSLARMQPTEWRFWQSSSCPDLSRVSTSWLHLNETPGPTGKSLRLCNCDLSSPFCKNISVFQKCKSGHINNHPVPKEGRCATSSTRDRMRWTRMAPLTKAPDADSEGVWS
jgi:hypothetical protein